MKISTYCPTAFPGVNAALTNLADLVKGVQHSNERIDETAGMIILGGWADPYQLLIRQLKSKGKRVGVWFTSSLGQSGFTPNLCEFAYLKTIFDMMDKHLIDYLFVGGRKIYYPLRDLHENVILLPFPLNVQRFEKYEEIHTPWKIIFFTPKHLYKNVANQLIALAVAQRTKPELDIHINGLEGTQFQFVADLFKLHYIPHGWLPDDEYYPLLGSAACSLQITYAEICNYSAMSAMAMGTPTLLSNVVDWLPHTKLNRNLVVGRFDSPEHIAEKILHVAEKPEQYSAHVKYMIRHVAHLNNQAVIHIMKELVE